MKRVIVFILVMIGASPIIQAQPNPDLGKLKIIIIRHGEKPPLGDNLNCQGLNRSMQLPKVIKEKFGVPDYVYVPYLTQGKATLHARMFQTVTPLVAKYNIPVNSKYKVNDYEGLPAHLKTKSGTVLLVWEHKAISYIVQALGIKTVSAWPDNDFDSIWIITFPNGVATLTKDQENIKPSADCDF